MNGFGPLIILRNVFFDTYRTLTDRIRLSSTILGTCCNIFCCTLDLMRHSIDLFGRCRCLFHSGCQFLRSSGHILDLLIQCLNTVINILHHIVDFVRLFLDLTDQAAHFCPHRLQRDCQLSEIITAFQKLISHRFCKISLFHHTDRCHTFFERFYNTDNNEDKKDDHNCSFYQGRCNEHRQSSCHITGKFVTYCGNPVINIIGVITCADNPLERFKRFAVGTFRRRFGLSFLWEYIIYIASVRLLSHSDDLLDHLISVGILGLHTVGTLCCTSQQYDIGSVILIYPEISGISIAKLTDLICCKFLCLRFRIHALLILVVNGLAERNYVIYLLLDLLIVRISFIGLHSLQCPGLQLHHALC